MNPAKDLLQSRRPLAWGAIIFAIWTVLALFFTSQDLMHQNYSGLQVGWQRVLGEWLLCSWVWAGLTAAIVPLARRVPFERGRIGRALAVHVPASVLSAGAHLTA